MSEERRNYPSQDKELLLSGKSREIAECQRHLDGRQNSKFWTLKLRRIVDSWIARIKREKSRTFFFKYMKASNMNMLLILAGKVVRTALACLLPRHFVGGGYRPCSVGGGECE